MHPRQSNKETEKIGINLTLAYGQVDTIHYTYILKMKAN